MGEERLLLRTQKNEILQRITDLKLNPIHFEFHRVKSEVVTGCVVTKLFHKPTRYYFTFDFSMYSNEEFFIKYFLTEESKKHVEFIKPWTFVMGNVVDWLMVIKREIEAPNLWATILEEKKLFEVVSGVKLGNELFSVSEQNYITEQLKLIKEQLIDTQELVGKEKEFVENRFNNLEDSLKRLGKYDWVNSVIGVAVTIIWGIALAPEQAKQLFSSLGKLISQVLGGGTFLPLP
jgi:hypothetical protein